jgi:flagellar motor protein MotB
MANSTMTGRNANRRVEVLIFNRDGTADAPR